LLAMTAKRVDVRAKLAQGERLRVGTSYPILTRSVFGSQASIEVQRGGSIESLPGRFPWLDGVVEIVRSGDSATTNGLSVVEDDLYQVHLLGLARSKS
jgi:ATP phosphoribosyltransferase